MAEFRMPTLGADMESGTLLQWRVKPGDAVHRGDIVAVVDTSKAEIEVEIFENGVIDELLVSEGTRVPVGTVLATVRSAEGDRATDAEAKPPPAAPPSSPATAAATPVVPSATRASTSPASVSTEETSGHRLRVSPVARRMAERLRVDLHTVTGSGPDRAITKADIERVAAGAPALPAVPAPTPAAAQPSAAGAPALPAVPAPTPAAAQLSAAPAPAPTAAQPPEPSIAAPTPQPPMAPATRPSAAGTPAAATPAASEPAERQAAMREAIGALMARSKREIPHYYLQTQIDMTDALAWLAEENLRRPVSERLVSSVLLLAAVAQAAAQTPAMNGFWVDGGFQAAGGVHLGVAISLRGGGLVAPAVHDADAQSLDELMAGLRDLVKRARSGRLRSSEMSDPTITVTNLGERGVDLVHGVIYPPQVALIGFGGIRERPWAADGMIGARSTVNATLAGDHRASDGHAGSRFLSLIDRLLQTPEEL